MSDTFLEEAAGEVRRELDQTYRFPNSRACVYTFDPENPSPKLSEILRSVGFSDESLAARLRAYRDHIAGATCIYTGGILDYDYVMLFSAKEAPEGEFLVKLGEETMHGEHFTRHKDGRRDYTLRFSGVAREFFGGSGQVQMMRKVCQIPPGKVVPDGFSDLRADYDQEADTFHLDIPHIAGYELAKAAALGEVDWKRDMFHEPDERRLWALYNAFLVPEIRIKVPATLDGKDRLVREVEEYLGSLGLRTQPILDIDETDTRGA